MASPQCVEIMAPIFSMLQSKTRHYNKLLQLRGKLDIVTKQISFANTNVDEELEAGSKDAEKEALLVYQVNKLDQDQEHWQCFDLFLQDDSSDELSERLDDMLIPDSDTDDDVLDEESDEVSEGDEEEEDSDENDPDPEPMTNGIGSESEEDVDDQ